MPFTDAKLERMFLRMACVKSDWCNNLSYPVSICGLNLVEAAVRPQDYKNLHCRSV